MAFADLREFIKKHQPEYPICLESQKTKDREKTTHWYDLLSKSAVVSDDEVIWKPSAGVGPYSMTVSDGSSVVRTHANGRGIRVPHPGLVKIFDYGQLPSGVLYMLMRQNAQLASTADNACADGQWTAVSATRCAGHQFVDVLRDDSWTPSTSNASSRSKSCSSRRPTSVA